MINSKVFKEISEDSFNRLSKDELLHAFGQALGLSNLASVSSGCAVDTKLLFQGDVEIQYVELTESIASKPGHTLERGDLVRMIKDTRVSEFSGPLPLRERLLGVIFQDSVQTFECDPLQTCTVCNGGGKCVTCSATGNVVCPECRGNGECANCSGSGSESCPTCEGSGNCSSCGGTGTVNCLICEGSGLCNVCNGSGECSNCNGSGTCGSCDGSGNCPDCDGDGSVQCEWCYGDGEVYCPDCNGSGNYIDDCCRRCNGCGTIYKNGRDVTCPVCDGSGRYVVECRRCDGTGRVECSNCGGDGEFTCSTCHGSGDCVTCRGTGNCKICHGDGLCRKCKGEKKCLRCNGRGNFWCSSCRKHDGKCTTCEGGGSITCTVCNGDCTCVSCEGDGKIQCPKCNGTKECYNCKASGKECCKKCDGLGQYQTFERYSLTPYDISGEYKISLSPFRKDEIKGEAVYSGLFKQWDRNSIEKDNTGSIAYMIEEPLQSKSFLDWLNNEVSSNQKEGYFPLYASCNVYKFKIRTVSYKVGEKMYSFAIGGKEHTVFYDSVPSKLNVAFRHFKKKFWQ